MAANDKRISFFKIFDQAAYYMVVQDEPAQRIRLDLLNNIEELLSQTSGYTKREVNYLIQKNIGKVFLWEGDWLVGTLYVENQIVFHEGSSWIALEDNTGNEPAEGSTIWELVARGVPRLARIGMQLTAAGVITAGTGKGYLRIGAEHAGYRLSGIAISCEDPPTSEKLSLQVVRQRLVTATDPRVDADVLSTPVTIDLTHRDSMYASVDPVIIAANALLAEGDRLRFDCVTGGLATGPVNISLSLLG